MHTYITETHNPSLLHVTNHYNEKKRITIRVHIPKSLAEKLKSMKLQSPPPPSSLTTHYQPLPLSTSIQTRKIRENANHNKLQNGIYFPTNKTKKKKNLCSASEKKNLWNLFDSEIEKTKHRTVEYVNQTPNTEEKTHCKCCGGYILIMEDGFPTCNHCGIIDLNVLDHSPEWRYYNSEDKHSADPTRCGNPINPLLMESSFGCKVLCVSKSSYDMKKIRTWTEWQSMPHREKSLYDEFQFITQMAQISGIPKIFIDDAIQTHKIISERKMLRGLNRDGIKAASIYLSCRKNGCPRTAQEIAEIFRLDKASATNGCSMAVNILNDIERSNPRNQLFSTNIEQLCITTPSSFIERYCSKLNMHQDIVKLAMFIAKKIEIGHLINDNAPDSIASGIVYFVSQLCKLNYTKNNIKGICGVSEVTINKCYKKIDAIKENIVPQSVFQKYVISKNE